MAKATLPTNFKDDILNSAMGGKRRYTQTSNTDGTVSLTDASTYDQVGSNFGAAQLNATNKAVNDSADASKIIDSLATIATNTESGYIAGAKAVKELRALNNKAEVTGTLSAGSTSITLSNSTITTSSTIDVYTNVYGVNPTAITVSAGKVTLTFDAQSSAVGVKVRVS